jgi:transposase-like protein
MPRGIPADRTHKAEIVSKIRDQGMSVSEASAQYQLSSKTIYAWLRDGVVDGNRNLILENNRLKKENEQLYKLLGRATAEMQRSKDEPSWKRSTRDGDDISSRNSASRAVVTTTHRSSYPRATSKQ